MTLVEKQADFVRTHEIPNRIGDPTRIAYDDLAGASDYFNHHLFAERLPRCLITMQRRRGAYGFFAGDRFRTVDGSEVTDEIALNPAHFHSCTTEQVLSTLVHEMTHLEHHHFGKPGRRGYHNKQWVRLMEAVGLIPSDTGAPGGKKTGYRVSHYIEPDGHFDRACRALLSQGFVIRYIEQPPALEPEKIVFARRRKMASKTVYRCPGCAAKVWGKPGLDIHHGMCGMRFFEFQV